MNVKELSYEQLTELKQSYLSEKLRESGQSISYDELAEVHLYVSDDEVFQAYAGVCFVPDDFFCTAE